MVIETLQIYKFEQVNIRHSKKGGTSFLPIIKLLEYCSITIDVILEY